MVALFERHVAAELAGDLATTMETMTDTPYFHAPPPIPTFIDTSHAIDELPEYDAFEPAPDDL